jgi:hypothetical protein
MLFSCLSKLRKIAENRSVCRRARMTHEISHTSSSNSTCTVARIFIDLWSCCCWAWGRVFGQKSLMPCAFVEQLSLKNLIGSNCLDFLTRDNKVQTDQVFFTAVSCDWSGQARRRLTLASIHSLIRTRLAACPFGSGIALPAICGAPT